MTASCCAVRRCRFRKPHWFPLLFIIVATLTFVALGSWQVERLAWKEHLLARIEQAQTQPILGTLPDDTTGLEYRRVKLTGTFKYDKAFHLIGRQHGNFPGCFMLTPFTLEDDGRVILVNRGFSPAGKESQPQGLQTIKGIIRPAREQRFFAPDNQPGRNVWFYEDLADMQFVSGLMLTPVIVEATGAEEPGIFPVPNDGKISLRNDHLGYAITWFATALIGLVMFAFYHRQPVENLDTK